MPRMPREQQIYYIINDAGTDAKLQTLRETLEKEIKDSEKVCTIGVDIVTAATVGNLVSGTTITADTKLSDIMVDMLAEPESPTGTFALYIYEGEDPLD